MYGGIKYICIVVQPPPSSSSRTHSSYKMETPSPWNTSSPFHSSPCPSLPPFYLLSLWFNYSSYLLWVEPYLFVLLWLAYFTWPHVLKVPSSLFVWADSGSSGPQGHSGEDVKGPACLGSPWGHWVPIGIQRVIATLASLVIGDGKPWWSAPDFQGFWREF